MRLADFILGNIEPILKEWEAFARSVWPGEHADPLSVRLRDHARDILRATAWDMKSFQTALQQSDKSKGDGIAGLGRTSVDGASDLHAIGRVRSGFDMLAVVAEYRALRASVIRLWRESEPETDLRDLDDLTRFNESIDQSLTEAVRSYTQQVDRSRQMFLAILGHDLRNPLNSIIMSAELLTLGEHVDDEWRVSASRITASATAMARMIADLLDFTGAGLSVKMPLSPSPMDLKSLSLAVVDEMRAAYPGRIFRFELHGDLSGEWDIARMRQVISNLLGNAIQHGADNEPIDLLLTDEGPEIRLAVRNGGSPIPPGAMPTIFDPLTRGMSPEQQRQRRPGSIGLGLYIAREVVTGHGGVIDVESTAKGGTIFTVRLPRRRGVPQGAGNHECRSTLAAGEKIE